MPQSKVPVNRWLVGVLAVTCLTTAVVIGALHSWEGAACAAFLRVGVLLAAFWMALPSRHREAAWANISPWTLVGCVALALVFVRWPPLFFSFVAMIVIASIFMKPRRR
jgi:lipid-A-disaccharide synthase-like uncharacterized protein